MTGHDSTKHPTRTGLRFTWRPPAPVEVRVWELPYMSPPGLTLAGFLVARLPCGRLIRRPVFEERSP